METALEIVENPDGVDCAALRELILNSYAYMDERIDPPGSVHRMDVAAFQKKVQDETLIVCLIKGQLVGCIFCRDKGEWLYTGKVAVCETRQGRGIGKTLFDHAFGLARRKKLRGLELETRIELTENHRIFEKLGFRKIGETAHEGYSEPTSLVMRAHV